MLHYNVRHLGLITSRYIPWAYLFLHHQAQNTWDPLWNKKNPLISGKRQDSKPHGTGSIGTRPRWVICSLAQFMISPGHDSVVDDLYRSIHDLSTCFGYEFSKRLATRDDTAPLLAWDGDPFSFFFLRVQLLIRWRFCRARPDESSIGEGASVFRRGKLIIILRFNRVIKRSHLVFNVVWGACLALSLLGTNKS